MQRFSVPDMHCDACVRAITGAVRSVDPAAIVEIDLARLVVEVDSFASPTALASAIEDAGFDAKPVLH